MTRSLETSSLDAARRICASLVDLWNAGLRSSAAVPAGLFVRPEAIRLYFGERASVGGDAPAAADFVDALLPRVQREVERFPLEFRDELFAIIYEQLSLRDENIRLRDEAAILKRDLHLKKNELETLERTILGRAVATAADVPAIAVSVENFERHISATSRHNSRQIMTHVRSFVATLPATRLTMMDVRGEDIGAWLDARVAAGSVDAKRAGRRDAIRRRLGRFINWCAAAHDYPSQMLKVKAVPKNDIARERGDIHWHDLTDVEAAIAALPEYWGAIVAALGYAGLQLAELAWLRPGDVNLAAMQIWITTVEDGEDKSVRHMLKTAHRRRPVRIHPTHLLPRLKKFVDDGYMGKYYFFAVPDAMRRERVIARGSAERWLVSTLTHRMVGHAGRRNKKGDKLPKVPGLLPAGMSAKSLRRTFGSLLLRSGKTTAEVAAAMGNTEDVVRAHYARILGCEVDVDF